MQPYQTEEDKQSGNFRTKKNITSERVIFYNEKHALAYGQSMREFLGVIDVDEGNSEEVKIFEKTAAEIKAMNLPKVNPDPGINRNIIRGNRTYRWDEYFRR